MDISSTLIYKFNEYFFRILKSRCRSGKCLFDAIVDELKVVEIYINDLREQGYDNKCNMEGKH